MILKPVTLTLRQFKPAAAVAAVVAGCLVYGPFNAAPARAQAMQQGGGGGGAVTGSGTVTLTRQPNVLRMTLEVTGEGKDVKEALAKLKAQEKAVREKLAGLGAAEGSVKFEDARINAAAAARQAQMEQMIRMRTGRGGKPPTTGPAQPPVNVAATLTVDWPLKAQSAVDLLVEAHDLQAKVRAAKLVEPAAAAGGTPEELEEAEERLGLVMNENGANPGEPTFLYVSKLSDDERAKATAEAFKKAKEEAARVAKAAGADLGSLRQLTSEAGAAMDTNPYGGGFDYSSPYGRAMFGAMQRQAAGAGDAAEAVGAQPGKVSYRVTVSASFALK